MRGLSLFSNCWGTYTRRSSFRMRATRATAPPMLSAAGVRISSAPRARISFFLSSLIFSGMTMMTLYPLSLPTMAIPIPVLPEVGSTIMESGLRWPSRSAPSSMARATRSLMLPPGFRNSALAKTLSPFNLMRGVLPIRSSMLSVSISQGDGIAQRGIVDVHIPIAAQCVAERERLLGFTVYQKNVLQFFRGCHSHIVEQVTTVAVGAEPVHGLYFEGNTMFLAEDAHYLIAVHDAAGKGLFCRIADKKNEVIGIVYTIAQVVAHPAAFAHASSRN